MKEIIKERRGSGNGPQLITLADIQVSKKGNSPTTGGATDEYQKLTEDCSETISNAKEETPCSCNIL